MSARGDPSVDTQDLHMESMGGATITPLSGLTIGMWKSRKHEHLWILVAPQKEMFVFLVKPWSHDCRVSPECGGRESRVKTFHKREAVLKQFGAESPFSFHSSSERGEGVIFGFEVGWRHVKGVNYRNPLVRQGKLVLEACEVEKKEFASIKHVKKYYGIASSRDLTTCQCGGVGNVLDSEFLDGARENLLERLDRAGDHEESVDDIGSASFEFCNAAGETSTASDGDSNVTGEYVSSSVTTTTRGFFTSLRRRKEKNTAKNSHQQYMREVMTEKTSSHANSLRIHVPPLEPVLCEDADENPLSVRVYPFRTISAEWTNVHVPCALLPVFEHEERLLKMYESGLPAWSMFLPAYGLYYRPWVRSMTWFLFYLFSVFSLTVGFWDLYKTLPGLQSALAKLVESMWLPPTAVLQWIEEHAQIRLSILLTYLFGKSEIFVFVMKNASIWWKSLGTIFEPIGRILSPVTSILRMTINTMTTTVFAPLKMAISLFLTPLSFIWQAMQQAWLGISAVYGILAGALKSLSFGSSAASLVSIGQGSTASEGWLLVSEAMRASFIKVLRATNSVWKFFINMCNGISRHNITLSRRYKRWRLRCQESLKSILVSLFWGVSDFFLTLHEKIFPTRMAAMEDRPGDASQKGKEYSQDNGSLSFSNAFLSKEEHHQVADTASSAKKP